MSSLKTVLFSGTNEISLDAKGRFAIPTRYRESFFDEHEGLMQLVITKSLFEPCLWLYTMEEWEVVVEKIGSLPTLSSKINRSIQRIVLGNAVICPIDTQGRVLLSAELRKCAAIQKKAALIGFNNKFELWSYENLKVQQELDEKLLKDGADDVSNNRFLQDLNL